MKHVDDYRAPERIKKLAAAIAQRQTRPCVLMEVCGGQTHSIVRHSLEQLLPESLELVHGPGCPVCVTAAQTIDNAIALAQLPDVTLCSFGDMLRVPGTATSLQHARAAGADVRMVYSPLDALALARANPDRRIVFFAVGFETTAPATALAVAQAAAQRLENFSLLVSHFLVPPAMRAILEAPDNRVQGFLAPGHVCAITGEQDYDALARQYHVPIVITGFEPVDILQGILHCVEQLERGEAVLENQYRRVVQGDGNPTAFRLVHEIFEVADQQWRGIGSIPVSGLRLTEAYHRYDAATLLPATHINVKSTHSGCISGEILRGLRKPTQCPHFGRECSPQQPLGAPMVSSEGACAAYYHYR
ncbi:MAG: hydrogenase formation protein HypD [Gammaproteobacteria bacterium]|nr:hydrogenase formation protein HypD [Gammaproteobacteria bacterium]